MRVHPDTPGPMADLGQPFVGGAAAVFDAKMPRNHRYAWMWHSGFQLVAQAQANRQHLQAFAAK